MKKKDVKNVLKAPGAIAHKLDTAEVKRLYAMLIAHDVYPVCPLCKEPIVSINDFSWDHIVPRSRGGSDHISNMAPTHTKCNENKGKVFIDMLFNVEYRLSLEIPAEDNDALSVKEIKRKKKYARSKSRLKEHLHTNQCRKR